MDERGDTPGPDRAAGLAVTTYAILFLLPLTIAATRSEVWSEPAALGAAGLGLSLLFGFVRRQRWAWALLLLFEVAALMSFAFAFTSVLALLLNIVTLSLLLSPPLRRYIAKARTE